MNVIDQLRKRCYNCEENVFHTGFLGGDLIGYLEKETKASQRVYKRNAFHIKERVSHAFKNTKKYRVQRNRPCIIYEQILHCFI